MNDETIRFIKARIRHDSITHRLKRGCTRTSYVYVWERGTGLGLCVWFDVFNILLFFGSNFSFCETGSVFSQHLGNRKKEICWTKTFFLRYLTNILKLWPFTSWQSMRVSVCNCEYFIVYAFTVSKIFRPSEMEQFRCINTELFVIQCFGFSIVSFIWDFIDLVAHT